MTETLDELSSPLPDVEGYDVCDVVEALAFDELETIADTIASYWISLREAAHRRDKMLTAKHLREARLSTFSAYLIVKDWSEKT